MPRGAAKIKDPPVEEFWWEQIRLGVEYRQKYGHSRDWTVVKNYWRNSFAEGVVPVNLIYSRGISILSNYYPRDPRIIITAPNRPDRVFHAKLVEAIDNFLIRKIGMKQVLKRCGLNSYLCGVGPWIVGYDSEFGFDPKHTDEVFKDVTLTGFSKKGQRIEYDSLVQPGMPWVEDVNTEDFVVPWGLTRWRKTPWYARRIIRPLEDLKADPKYENTDDLEPNVGSDTDRRDTRREAVRKMADVDDFVEFYEIHHLPTGKVYAVSMNHGKYLRNDVDELQIGGLNAGVVAFNEDADFFWPISDALYLTPIQQEINDLNTQWAKHRRAAVAKIIAKNKAFKPEEIDKLTSEQVKAIIEMSGDVQKDVRVMEPHIPDDFRIGKGMLMEDARELVGQSRVQAGEFQGKTHVSRAEVTAVAQGAEIRMDSRRDVAADAVIDMIRKINQIIFKFWTNKRVAQIVGPKGEMRWIEYSGVELRGEYDLQVDMDAGLPETKEKRREELLKAIEFIQKTGGDPKPVVRQYLSEFPGIDVDAVYGEIQSAQNGPMPLKQFVQQMNQVPSAQPTPVGVNGNGAGVVA